MSTIAADVGRLARALPRRAAELPRRAVALPRALNFRLALLVVVLLAILAATYIFWFRNSSFVAVDEVEVRGLTLAEEDVRAALTGSAEKMTTLNVDRAELEAAVEGFPTVAGVSVTTDFPHGLEITVEERTPVATLGADPGVPVAGDGTVLAGIELGEGTKVPALEVGNPPSSGRLEGAALDQAHVLGAAPEPLLPAIRESRVDPKTGIVVELVEEIELRFGSPAEAEAKWAAAAAILADPKLDQLAYIDLRIPGRPAVGGAELPAPTAEGAGAAATEAGAAAATEISAPDPAATAPAAAAPAAPVTPAPASAAPAPAPAPTAPATGVAGGAPAP